METKHCGKCNKRKPSKEFQKNQTLCKKCRRETIVKISKENRDKILPPDYKKYCVDCKDFQPKTKFWTDKSQNDGLGRYCRDHSEKRRLRTLAKRKTSSIYPRADFRKVLSGMLKEFREKLLKAILVNVTDESRSIVRQVVEDFKHEGMDISFAGREWQIQIMNSMSPNIVIRKPSQKGLTWLLERFVFALLMRYNDKPYIYQDHLGNDRARYLEAIYSFETVDKAGKWSVIRLEKIKKDNVHIRDALKIGKVERSLLMQFGRTSLHLVGRATVSGVLTISADIVIRDELDRDQNPAVSNQIGSRLLESPFMNTPSTKGLLRTTSTPEVSGAGVSLQYEESNQMEWEIRCDKCDTWQVLAYPDCIGNFFERGETFVKDENDNDLIPYWRCQNCHEPIDWTTIGNWSSDDPDYYENCRWVERNPKGFNPETGMGIEGYQVPFADANRTALFFIAERDDPDHDISYLYNHLLGLPYDDETKTLNPSNFNRVAGYKWGYNGKARYVLGCDHNPAQGGFIVIWMQLPDTISGTNQFGRWVCVYLEHLKRNNQLWDSPSPNEEVTKGRLWELITEYEIDVAVVDLEPDTNEVEKLIREFGMSKRVWADKSGMYADTFKIVEEEIVDEEVVPICRVYEDKVAAIDLYFNMIRFRNISFLDKNSDVPDAIMTEFISSHTNLYKGEIETKDSKGGKIAALNTKEVYKKRVHRIKDHWTMASKFAAQATRICVLANRIISGIYKPTIKGMGRIPGT